MSTDGAAERGREFVTFEIAGSWFGAEVSDVQDVFAFHQITPVPQARHDLAGLLNLRGRIVTAIDARRRLGLPDRETRATSMMAIGVERDGESYGVVVDKVGEVLRLDDDLCEEPPSSLDEAWREIARGIYRLRDGLLVAVDIHRMLDPAGAAYGLAA